MQAEDNSRTRLLIAVSVMDQLNKMGLSQEQYWEKFVLAYNVRTGDNSGEGVAKLLRENVIER